MNAGAVRPDVNDCIAIGKDSAHRERVVVDCDCTQPSGTNRAKA